MVENIKQQSHKATINVVTKLEKDYAKLRVMTNLINSLLKNDILRGFLTKNVTQRNAQFF